MLANVYYDRAPTPLASLTLSAGAAGGASSAAGFPVSPAVDRDHRASTPIASVLWASGADALATWSLSGGEIAHRSVSHGASLPAGARSVSPARPSTRAQDAAVPVLSRGYSLVELPVSDVFAPPLAVSRRRLWGADVAAPPFSPLALSSRVGLHSRCAGRCGVVHSLSRLAPRLDAAAVRAALTDAGAGAHFAPRAPPGYGVSELADPDRAAKSVLGALQGQHAAERAAAAAADAAAERAERYWLSRVFEAREAAREAGRRGASHAARAATRAAVRERARALDAAAVAAAAAAAAGGGSRGEPEAPALDAPATAGAGGGGGSGGARPAAGNSMTASAWGAAAPAPASALAHGDLHLAAGRTVRATHTQPWAQPFKTRLGRHGEIVVSSRRAVTHSWSSMRTRPGAPVAEDGW